MGRDDEDSPVNLFIRFKHHVDSNIAAGFGTLFGASAVKPLPHQSSATSPPTSHNSSKAMDDAGTARNTHEGQDLEYSSSEFFTLSDDSLYSPLVLRALPQPRPNDLPSHLDPSVFTFEDAFEDLMAVSLGRPLPEITKKYASRKIVQEAFPQGEPFSLWLGRVQSQSFLGTEMEMPDSLGSNEDLMCAVHDYDLDEYLGQASKILMRLMDKAAASSLFGEETSQELPPREPRDDEDLYSAVDSAFATGQGAWDALMKTIADDQQKKDARDQVSEKSAGSANSENERQVVTRDEYVDAFGLVHSTVRVRREDRAGNVIGKSTTYTIRTADPKSGDGEENPGREDAKGREHQKKRGWFWK